MSEVTLNLFDTRGAWHGRVHGGLLESVVAALSAEPETIEELEAALARFHKTDGERGAFLRLHEGECDEAWDAGLVSIDLPARVTSWNSTYSDFLRQGEVAYHNDRIATDIWIPYQTPDDWLVAEPLQDWRSLAERRRKERIAATFDAREVLYREVANFLAQEYISAANGDTHKNDSAIHAHWLMTSRADLRGLTPRQCLLAKQKFIDLDLQWRGVQWSFTGECPPGLSPESHAYCFGGFGTHEIVLYYELIRHLLATCANCPLPDSSAGDLAALLRAEQQRWLHAGQPEMHGFSPYLMIEYERARLPLTVAAKEFFDDKGCPVCEEMLLQSGPCFWHLDGYNMEQEFAFSFHHTREEWEEEQRSWQNMDDEFNGEGSFETLS